MLAGYLSLSDNPVNDHFIKLIILDHNGIIFILFRSAGGLPLPAPPASWVAAPPGTPCILGDPLRFWGLRPQTPVPFQRGYDRAPTPDRADGGRDRCRLEEGAQKVAGVVRLKIKAVF